MVIIQREILGHGDFPKTAGIELVFHVARCPVCVGAGCAWCVSGRCVHPFTACSPSDYYRNQVRRHFGITRFNQNRRWHPRADLWCPLQTLNFPPEWILPGCSSFQEPCQAAAGRWAPSQTTGGRGFAKSNGTHPGSQVRPMFELVSQKSPLR